jgi:hypothetical protein
MSLLLGVAFIIVSIIGIISIYAVIISKKASSEDIDKIIDLCKWFIVSVAITLSTSIVNDGFKEREQDIKEMEVFDKYVNTIALETIDKRKLLCEFFASVSPDGEMRNAWKRYEVTVDKHLAEKTENTQKISDIEEKEIKGDASAQEIQEKTRLEEKILTVSQSLISASNQDTPEWAIIVGSDINLKAANDELKKASKLKYPATIYKNLNRYRTIVGPFLDHETALNALPEIKQEVRSSSYLVNMKTWCKTPEMKDGYLECKM